MSGYYEYKVITNELANVPLVFQAFVNKALHKFLNGAATVYIEYILIICPEYRDM